MKCILYYCLVYFVWLCGSSLRSSNSSMPQLIILCNVMLHYSTYCCILHFTIRLRTTQPTLILYNNCLIELILCYVVNGGQTSKESFVQSWCIESSSNTQHTVCSCSCCSRQSLVTTRRHCLQLQCFANRSILWMLSGFVNCSCCRQGLSQSGVSLDRSSARLSNSHGPE